MNSIAVSLVCCSFVLSYATDAGSEYCGIKVVDDKLKAVGYIADNKFATKGAVCPSKCSAELLTEVNVNCGAKFQAKCVGSCDSKDKKHYDNCCLLSGENHKGECNSYYFANVNGSQEISFVRYTGSVI